MDNYRARVLSEEAKIQVAYVTKRIKQRIKHGLVKEVMDRISEVGALRQRDDDPPSDSLSAESDLG